MGLDLGTGKHAGARGSSSLPRSGRGLDAFLTSQDLIPRGEGHHS